MWFIDGVERGNKTVQGFTISTVTYRLFCLVVNHNVFEGKAMAKSILRTKGLG
jgi:hypothetical protein